MKQIILVVLSVMFISTSAHAIKGQRFITMGMIAGAFYCDHKYRKLAHHLDTPLSIGDRYIVVPISPLPEKKSDMLKKTIYHKTSVILTWISATYLTIELINIKF